MSSASATENKAQQLFEKVQQMHQINQDFPILSHSEAASRMAMILDQKRDMKRRLSEQRQVRREESNLRKQSHQELIEKTIHEIELEYDPTPRTPQPVGRVRSKVSQADVEEAIQQIEIEDSMSKKSPKPTPATLSEPHMLRVPDTSTQPLSSPLVNASPSPAVLFSPKSNSQLPISASTSTPSVTAVSAPVMAPQPSTTDSVQPNPIPPAKTVTIVTTPQSTSLLQNALDSYQPVAHTSARSASARAISAPVAVEASARPDSLIAPASYRRGTRPQTSQGYSRRSISQRIIYETGFLASTLRSEWNYRNLDLDSNTTQGVIDWRAAFGSGTNRHFKNRESFLFLRVVLASIMWFIFFLGIYQYIQLGRIKFWITYLTHWTMTMECVYLTFAAITTYKSNQWPSPSIAAPMPWYVRWMWLTQSIALPGSFFVMVGFWTLVWDRTFPIPYYRFLSHGVNFLVMVIDNYVSCQPYLLLHGVYFVLYGLSFVLFSLVYYALGLRSEQGTRYLAPNLDWQHPLSSALLTSLLLLIGFPLINFFFWWGVYRRRLRLGLIAAHHPLEGSPRSSTASASTYDQHRFPYPHHHY